MGCSQKCLYAIVAVPPALVRVSRLSTNDKGDNKILLGTVHRSPGIYFTVEENLSWETVDEGCVTSHRFKCNPSAPNEVVRIAQNVRKGVGRKNGKDEVG